MNLFKKLFSSKPESQPEKNPENTRLIFLLNNYGENRSQTNYELVMKELLEGNSFLILPTISDKYVDDWTIAEEETKLKLTSVFNLEGLKVLGAFSDEKSLLNWAKKPTAYTKVQSQAALDMCKDINVNRVVINSDSPNMFVVERNNQAQTIDIGLGETLLIGTPAKPISEDIKQRLITRFASIENVQEAYQYEMSRANESSIVIALKLQTISDNARKAVIFAVQDILANEKSDTFFDMFFLADDDWYERVKNVEDSLFYKKST